MLYKRRPSRPGLISQALHTVSEKIKKREITDYFDQYANLKDSVGELKESNVREFFFVEKNKSSNETFIYSHGILE